MEALVSAETSGVGFSHANDSGIQHVCLEVETFISSSLPRS
jgi:hypothetical protein